MVDTPRRDRRKVASAKDPRPGLMIRADKAKLDLLTVNADSGWLDVGGYGTNFSAYDPVGFRPQYRKLPNGVVIFRGLIKKSVALVANELMFTVPAGYRTGNPSSGIYFFPTAGGAMEFRVFSTGGFYVGAVAPVAGSNVWISLDHATYLAEN